MEEQSGASRMTAEQRESLERIIEKHGQREHGFIGEAEVRINLLWGIYLRVLLAAAQAALTPKRKPDKNASPALRRSTLRSLKDHLGRPPTVEDLVSSFAPEIEIDESIVDVVRRDISLPGLKAKRRTRTEILDDKIKRLQEKVLKSGRVSRKRMSKKGDKK
ncbi:MAG TPA: hypothetical protein VFS10_09820 [Pyrinomonadaceae bacterium]|nr:hypothetical protein [Pyrinomonadaceae bacterium]